MQIENIIYELVRDTDILNKIHSDYGFNKSSMEDSFYKVLVKLYNILNNNVENNNIENNLGLEVIYNLLFKRDSSNHLIYLNILTEFVPTYTTASQCSCSNFYFADLILKTFLNRILSEKDNIVENSCLNLEEFKDFYVA